MQNYYDEEDDLPTTTAAVHQLEIDNYLKFGQINQQNRIPQMRRLQVIMNIIHYTSGRIIIHYIHV